MIAIDRHILVLICILLAATQMLWAAEGEKPYKKTSKWQLKEFMISTWGAPTDEASTALFAESGFNVVMAHIPMLDTLAKYGIKSIVMGVRPEDVAKIKDHPAVWGYFVKDEPWNQKDYDEAAAKADAIRKVDSSLPCYVNLGGPIEDHAGYLNTVRPDFLSFDYYQWWWTSPLSKTYYSRLESYRKVALEAGLPLISWVESSSDPEGEHKNPDEDNPQKLRHSVYTNLAYGVKGIQWFTSWLAFIKGEDGVTVRNRTGDDIAAINAELKVLGPVLIRLVSTDVFHTSPVTEGCKMLPISFWVSTDNKNVVIGVFKDPKNIEYLLVVNKDWQNANNIKLEFDSAIKKVEILNKSTGKWKSAMKYRGLELPLDMGDGALLRIAR